MEQLLEPGTELCRRSGKTMIKLWIQNISLQKKYDDNKKIQRWELIEEEMKERQQYL